MTIRDHRTRRRWSLHDLAVRSGLSVSLVQAIESGRPASIESYARLCDALGLRLELLLTAASRRPATTRDLDVDLVHSAMAEFEAAHLRQFSLPVALDEPYQHYQFAGRADLVAWDLSIPALLHIENRTRFPNLQEAAGGFAAKRAYLPGVLAARLGVRRWRSETHVMACLWSAEVLHALRLRSESFRSICPDVPSAFDVWWSGAPPDTGGTSTLVVIDPLATTRQRLMIDLDRALVARPRYAGYAEAARRLAAAYEPRRGN